MNQKHLQCRGKSAGGWAIGYYLPDSPVQNGTGPVIFCADQKGKLIGVYLSVDSDTVTICSGMEDQNNKLIFDQDLIANYRSKEAGLVEYSEADGQFALVMKDGTMKNFSDLNSAEFEIVGNAFDNPDYLELI